MAKNFSLFLILCVIKILAFAQSPKISFEHLNMRNGLPGEYVGTILQDEKGYIWFSHTTSITRYDGYRFKNYRIKLKGFEGSQNSLISSMFLDKNNTIWVCTFGNNLFQYNPVLDSLVLIKMGGNRVSEGYYTQFSFVDRENQIWSASLRNESESFLDRYDPRSKDRKTFSSAMKGDQYFGMNQGKTFINTSDGEFILGSTNGFYYFDFNEKKFKVCLATTDSLQQLTIGSIYRESSGERNFWFLANKIKAKKLILYSYNLQTNSLKNCLTLPGDFAFSANAIFEDRKGMLWVTTTSGLFQYDKSTNQKIDYLFPASDKDVAIQSIHSVLVDSQNNFWISTTAGLVNFIPALGKFRRYKANQSNPDALGHIHITKLFEDRSGLIWVGMDEYGVDRITTLHAAFTEFKNNPDVAGSYPENTTGMAPKDNGDYWITSQQGIFNWDVKKNIFSRILIPGKKANEFTSNALIFSDGTLCYFDNDGLNFYGDNNKIKTVAIPNYDGIMSLYIDRKDQLWILTDKGKIYKANDKRTALEQLSYTATSGQSFKIDSELVINSGCIYEDFSGTIWVATSKTGLGKIDFGKKQVIVNPTMRGDIFNDVTRLLEDKQGNFWISTVTKGFWQFDKKSGKLVKEIRDDHQILSGGVSSIQEDNDGNIWIASQKGLAKFNYQKDIVLDFTVANDIPFEVPRKLLKKSSGEFILVMFNSMLQFNPGDIKSNTIPPRVQVENIVYSDPKNTTTTENTVNVLNDSSLTLSYNENRITFNYVALHFINSAQNKYAYMLENYDKTWIQAQNQRSVTYNNLAAGTYIFRVKAANSDGVWNNTGTSYTLVIESPWWLRWWAWVLYVLVFGAAVYGFINYRSRRLIARNKLLEQRIAVRTQQLSKANEELHSKQQEITSQRDQLAETLDDLKTTQTQLVQSEKMASLGELTAGIAHEIQNPLNFVNNFSEVNIELLDEMEAALAGDKKQDVIEIAADIRQNLLKINHHGNRADGIVKNMLQHSRNTGGERQMTNINLLANEYLRLAFHGFRAKNKNFNVHMVTTFDERLPQINILSQDIGRVLINLYNNAFYSVQRKEATTTVDYQPTIEVTSSLKNNLIEIKVKDNGVGIPQAIRQKIMQPFFTTKPTGEGTGLGLSLSYDIVVEGHGGNIEVDSKEGEGATFTISLPVK